MMRYYSVKLEFTTPVRFGLEGAKAGLPMTGHSCHADTLFSALVGESVGLFGPGFPDELAAAAEKGDLLLSDLFPYDIYNEEYFLPRPVGIFKNKTPQGGRKADDSASQKKALKKLEYICLPEFEDFLSSLKEGTVEVSKYDKYSIWAEHYQQRAAVTGRDQTEPYLVSSVSFHSNPDTAQYGLYFLLGTEDHGMYRKLEQLTASLGLTGLGGKRSSGLGKFISTVERIKDDNPMYSLLNKKADKYMNLSVCLPASEDMDAVCSMESAYILVRRGGFIYSDRYQGSPIKKKSLCMLSSGSTFPSKLSGSIVTVHPDGFPHNVYRYGKPISVGVAL